MMFSSAEAALTRRTTEGVSLELYSKRYKTSPKNLNFIHYTTVSHTSQ
jgi:hypothetical protein